MSNLFKPATPGIYDENNLVEFILISRLTRFLGYAIGLNSVESLRESQLISCANRLGKEDSYVGYF